MNEATAAYLDLAAAGAPLNGLLDRVPVPEWILQPGEGRLLRPLFLPEELATRAGADLRIIFDLLVSLPHRLFDGDFHAFGRALGLTPDQVDLARRGRAGAPVAFGRADLYLHRGVLTLLEFNLGSAVAGLDLVELNRALLTDPAFHRFAAEHRLGFHDPMARVADELRRLVTEPTGDRPVVVLTNWPARYDTYRDMFGLLAKLLSGPDLDVRTVPLRELRVGPDGVRIGATKVDVVYRFFGLTEVSGATGGPRAVEDRRLVEDLLRADEAGTTRLFLPLDYSLYGGKRALAMLSDERNRAAFTPAEAAAIDRILPWTRPLVPGVVHTPHGPAELEEYCRQHQRELILKSSLGFSAEGVVAGWECDPRTWREALGRAVRSDYVVQQRIPSDPEPGGLAGGGSADSGSGDFAVNWGLFVTGDGYAGGVARGLPAANDPVIGGGGSLVGCVYHIAADPRSGVLANGGSR